MMSSLEEFVLVVLVPVVLLTLKSLLSQEIAYWISFLSCYFCRPFDVDGDPSTHDWAMIYNPGNGEWKCCSLTFKFGFRKEKNGAFIHHYDENWDPVFVQRVPFSKWNSVTKGKILDTSRLEGLNWKIQRIKNN